MNELEFRKQCIIDPHTTDSRFQDAMNDPVYRKIWEEYCDFDEQLKEAANLPVSFDTEALYAIPDQSSADEDTGWFRGVLQHPVLSTAASIVVAFVVTFGILLQPKPALSDAIFADLYHHMEVMYLRTPADDRKFRDLLEYFGARSDIQIANLHYVHLCGIGEHEGLHLVFDGETGPVTLYYVPSERVDRLSMIAKDQFHGVMFPAGSGTMAIIGTMDEDVMKIKSEIEGKFIWVNNHEDGGDGTVKG